MKSCKGFTPSHPKQVSALSRQGDPYLARYRPAFAFCFFLCPLHHGHCLRVGCQHHRSDDGGASGLPRFPRCPIQPAGRKMGLGTFYPPRVLREQTEMDDSQFQTRGRFGPSSLSCLKRQALSWFIVTAVLTNVHLCFPYPIPRHLLIGLPMCRTPSLVCCALDGAGCLSVAPYNPITRIALTDGVMSFQTWFRFTETRHLERCRLAAQEGAVTTIISNVKFCKSSRFGNRNSCREAESCCESSPGDWIQTGNCRAISRSFQ